MKKILLAFLLAIMLPLSAFAISLDEINSSPNRYVKVTEDAKNAFYVDVSIIKSLRYSPPYYVLQCRSFYISYERNYICQQLDSTFSYDYNKNYISQFKKIISSHPNYKAEQISQLLDLADEEVKKDSGIIYNAETVDFYNFDGTYQFSAPPAYAEKVIFGSNLYATADFVFKKYYGISFTSGSSD